MTASTTVVAQMMAAHKASQQAGDAFEDALADFWGATGRERAWARANVRRTLAAMRNAWRSVAAHREEFQALREATTERGTGRGRHGAMPYSRERRALLDERNQLTDYLQHLRAVAVSCGGLNEPAMLHVEEAIELLAAQHLDLVGRYAVLDAREAIEDLAAERIPEHVSFASLAEQISNAPPIAKRTRKTASPEELRRQTALKLPIEGGKKEAAGTDAAKVELAAETVRTRRQASRPHYQSRHLWIGTT